MARIVNKKHRGELKFRRSHVAGKPMLIERVKIHWIRNFFIQFIYIYLIVSYND